MPRRAGAGRERLPALASVAGLLADGTLPGPNEHRYADAAACTAQIIEEDAQCAASSPWR